MLFRLDFSFRIFMDLFFYAMNIIFFQVIYLHTKTLGGWNFDQILIFVTTFLLADAMAMTIYSNGCWWLPHYINRGDLDYYLTRPVSSLFFLTLREFAANSFINLLFAIGLLSFALMHADLNFSYFNILLYFFFMASGIFLHYCLRIIALTPIFWSQGGRGLEEFVWSLDQIKQRPHTIFTNPTRMFFLTILPYGLMCSVPASFLFKGPDYQLIILCLLVTLAMGCIMLKLWSKGLKNYSSASS